MGVLDNKITIIVEVGCNHCGDFNFAKKFIDEISSLHGESSVQVVKFQKRTPELILTPEEFAAPHPCPENAFGTTYGKHRLALEFNLAQHKELKSYVEAKGLSYSCSVFESSFSTKSPYLKLEMISTLEALFIILPLVSPAKPPT